MVPPLLLPRASKGEIGAAPRHVERLHKSQIIALITHVHGKCAVVGTVFSCGKCFSWKQLQPVHQLRHFLLLHVENTQTDKWQEQEKHLLESMVCAVWHMLVFVCTCMFVLMCVCARVCIWLYTCVWLCLCVRVCVLVATVNYGSFSQCNSIQCVLVLYADEHMKSTCTHTRTHAHTHVHVYVCLCVCVCVCVSVWVCEWMSESIAKCIYVSVQMCANACTCRH